MLRAEERVMTVAAATAAEAVLAMAASPAEKTAAARVAAMTDGPRRCAAPRWCWSSP